MIQLPLYLVRYNKQGHYGRAESSGQQTPIPLGTVSAPPRTRTPAASLMTHTFLLKIYSSQQQFSWSTLNIASWEKKVPAQCLVPRPGTRGAPEAASDAAVTMLYLRGTQVAPDSRSGWAHRITDLCSRNGEEDAGGHPCPRTPLPSGSSLCSPNQVRPQVRPSLPLQVVLSPASLFLLHSGGPGLPARVRSGCQEAGEGTDLNPAVKFRAANSCRRGVAVSQGAGVLLLLLTAQARLVRAGT